MFLFALPFPVVIGAAAFVGVARSFNLPGEAGRPEQVHTPKAGTAFATALGWAAIWLAPLAGAFATLGPDHVVTRVGLLFSKLALVTFGGAYTVLAYLQQQAVEAEGWLTAPQMIDGLGLAETTPGPLVLVNQFVGFMAGWQTGGGGLALAAAASLMASWCTFAPSFVWIFAGAPLSESLRRNRFAAGALNAITAAVFGIILKIALVFGFAVLFRLAVQIQVPGGGRVTLPDPGTLDPLALLISAVAATALIRFKANILIVVIACALAGLVRLVLPPGS